MTPANKAKGTGLNHLRMLIVIAAPSNRKEKAMSACEFECQVDSLSQSDVRHNLPKAGPD
jgi:hypothetical protein